MEWGSIDRIREKKWWCGYMRQALAMTTNMATSHFPTRPSPSSPPDVTLLAKLKFYLHHHMFSLAIQSHGHMPRSKKLARAGPLLIHTLTAQPHDICQVVKKFPSSQIPLCFLSLCPERIPVDKTSFSFSNATTGWETEREREIRGVKAKPREREREWMRLGAIFIYD